MDAERGTAAALLLGRYRVHDEIAAGGMATVHLGRIVGDEGFSRTVAVKRLHPWHAKNRDVVAMFTDEARIAARIRHANVVGTLDVVSQDGEVFLVMEYVHGAPLSSLIATSSRRKQRIPPRIVASTLAGALRGLHAAHEARDARGDLLGVVHRDVSPQNVLVGTDGVARVLDFGIARAAGRAHVTGSGDHTIKGKLAYMSPEQLRGEELDRRSDIYAAGVVLWEALTCKRLYTGASGDLAIARLLEAEIELPSKRVAGLPAIFDEVTRRALERLPGARYGTALEMAMALEEAGPLATPSEVGAWVEDLAADVLSERARLILAIENEERRSVLPMGERVAPRVEEPPTAVMPSAARSALVEAPWMGIGAGGRSVEEARPIEKGKNRAGLVVAAFAGIFVLAGALVGLGKWLRGAGEATIEAPASATAAPVLLPSAALPAISTNVAPAISSSSAAPEAPTAPKPNPTALARPSSAPTRPAPKTDCDPPYTIDASGRKKYKRQCL